MNVNNKFINKLKQSKDLDIFTGKEGYGLFSNKKLDVLILFAFAFMGVLIKLLFNTKVDNSGDQGSASGTIWGYGLSVISMLCILFMLHIVCILFMICMLCMLFMSCMLFVPCILCIFCRLCMLCILIGGIMLDLEYQEFLDLYSVVLHTCQVTI